MAGWERRVAPVLAAAGVLLLLPTAGVAIAARGLSQRTALLLGAGLALIAVHVVVDPRGVAALARRPRSRPRSRALVLGAAVAGALVGANVLASSASRGVDLTRAGLHTLSPRSVQVARQLPADLVVTGFFRPGEQQARRDAQDLLDLYRQRSPRVRVRFVDPDQDTALALRLGATVTRSVVLQYRTRTPVVLNQAEQTEAGVTGAILRLESSRSPMVCWATGDGERDLRDPGDVAGYSAVADLLRTSDYRVQEAPVGAAVAPACDVVVVAQLARPLPPGAVAAIQEYLGRGGKLLMALDPWPDAAVLASANAVLLPYGAVFDGGLVVEPDPVHSAADDATIPIVTDFGASPITRDLARRYVFFPQATPITGAVAAGVTSATLASSTAGAFAIPRQRTSLARRAGDEPGPFALARSIEARRAAGTTRIVLVGTSALAENRAMPPAAQGANPDLLLASLDWLSQQEPLVAVPPRAADASPLSLGEAGLRVNEVLTVAVLPLLVAAIGVLARTRRRRPAKGGRGVRY